MVRREGKKLLFILPSGAGILIFYLLPLIYCFLYAFSGTSGRFRFAGGTNYFSLLRSETFRLAIGNTYLMMFLCVAVLMLVSLVLVYFLDSGKGTLGLLLICSLPMLLPGTLIVRCLEEVDIAPRMTLLFIFLWKYTGFHVLLLKVIETNMSIEWTEAAVLEKANKWQVFTRIRLCYLWPYIRFLLIFDGICFFRLFRESYLLYGIYPPEQVYMISNFFFNNFQNLNYRRLSAAAVITLIPLLLFFCVLLKVGEKHEMV